MSMEAKFFLEPWGNRIVIKEDDAPNMIGLIIVPDGAKRRSTVGTVVAVGDGVPFIEPPEDAEFVRFEDAGEVNEQGDPIVIQHETTKRKLRVIEIGDRVFCSQFSGTGVSFRGKPLYRILSTDEVLAKVLESDVELTETTA